MKKGFIPARGLKGWIEVFRTGKHVDSKGRVRNFTAADLDMIVDKYDPSVHEAPAVIGHPKTNDPAYAWVEGIKRAGNVLLARLKDVNDDFAEMVEKGAFKKRSISLYPDMTLRHIGFLGASAPAIKGLKDISFSEDEEFSEFEEEFKNNKKKEDKDMPEIDELKKKLADEEAARKAAEEAAESAKKEAGEYKEKAEGLEASFSESEKKRREKEISDFVEQGIKDGKILPAWKEQGIADFMAALDEEEYEFSEYPLGHKGKKEKPLEWFKGFISSFSEHPLFKEMVKPAEDKNENAEFAECDKAADEMAAMVNEIREA